MPDQDMIELLKSHGLTDEEIAKLGNDETTWESLQKQHAKQVIKPEWEIPAGQDREIGEHEFREIIAAGYEAVNSKGMLSDGLEMAGTAIKTAIKLYLAKQTGGLVG